MIVSTTRLRLRSYRYLLPFGWQVFQVYRQVKKSSGNRGIKLLKSRGLTFWTCTLWQDRQALMTFSHNGTHDQGSSNLQIWCDEAAHGHWPGSELPSWKQAAAGLVEHGRLNELTYPSARQQAGEFNLD